MSTGTRVPIREADAAASELVMALEPAVNRIEVAGSIRRGRQDVGDIELVAVPQYAHVQDGMFGTKTVNRLTERVDELIAAGVLRPHPTDPKRGDRYSKLIEPTTGLQLDLFSAAKDTFGLILLIRTGPAEYSQRFVTEIRRRGLHVAHGQLHVGSLGCGSIDCEVVPTPEERDVYAAAKWASIPPGARA